MRKSVSLAAILAGAVLSACAHTGGSSALPTAVASSYAARSNAGSFKSLYSFQSFPDGEEPAGALIALNGTLYGTTQTGGKGGAGAVFASSVAGKERVIHSFGGSGDGVFPVAGLVELGGLFYGT
ncbi:MAG TPA: choice-of-anchor tandem repeat GloVer-containing protein, partial [Candidatus Nitrosotalea sp.]|nr:choice-of-anchor tandem repeat GloVer-containing protein [Candidatus Nitrosotalea sp.]